MCADNKKTTTQRPRAVKGVHSSQNAYMLVYNRCRTPLPPHPLLPGIFFIHSMPSVTLFVHSLPFAFIIDPLSTILHDLLDSLWLLLWMQISLKLA